MPVSVGINASRAYSQIDKVERKLKAMLARQGVKKAPTPQNKKPGRQAKYTAALVDKVAKTVEITTQEVAIALAFDSPRWSYWFVSNWNHAQGQKPPIEVTPTPEREVGLYAEFAGDIIGNVELDGSKPQYLFNTTAYAERITIGSDTDQLTSASPDWFTRILQMLESGVYVRAAVRTVQNRSLQ